MACLEDEPDVVLGYVVASPGVVHWIFVKKAWRELGIARKLFPQEITRVSHLTKVGEILMKKYDLYFDPFL